MKDSDLLTYEEARSYCRLKTLRVLRAAVRRHELEAVRLGFRTVRFRKTEIDRWLTTKRTKVIK